MDDQESPQVASVPLIHCCTSRKSRKSRILIQKLTFLLQLLSDDTDVVTVSEMHALLDDPDSICIIRECRELEAVYNLKFTDTIFGDAHSVHLQNIKKEVLMADKTMLLDLCTTKSQLIAR